MFARIALVIALLFPSLASADDALKFADSPQLATAVVTQELGDAPDRPGDTHVIAVHAADGDTYTVHQALDATIDGKPILLAQADTGSGSALAPTDGTAGSATTPAAPQPADKLHDPAEHPAQAWDDLKATKKVGWPLAVFAGLIMLCKLLGRAKKYKLAAFLSKGKTPVLIGMAGALAVACFNAAAEGGAWTAVFVAGVTAAAHYHDADPKTEE